MDTNRISRIISIVLVSSGILFFILQFVVEEASLAALPVAFLMLAGIFFVAALYFTQRQRWGSALFIPAFFMLGLGIMFLFSVITADWNAWAYGWLVPISGAGLGVAICARRVGWQPIFSLVGLGVMGGGLVLALIFGAIARGAVFGILVALLLGLCGLALRWIKLEEILPQGMIKNAPAPLMSNEIPATAPVPTPDETLSARELDVLRLVEQGLSNQQIAETLVGAPSTVKTHINNIYGKLGVQNRVQAINRARELGLI